MTMVMDCPGFFQSQFLISGGHGHKHKSNLILRLIIYKHASNKAAKLVNEPRNEVTFSLNAWINIF